MFGVDESYDREGDGPIGGTPWDPAAEAAATEDTAAEETTEATEPIEAPVDDHEVAAVREPAANVAVPPMPEPTGDERVDVALARLGELSGAPVADHVEVFEDVQRRLQDVLAAVDQDDAVGEQERSGPPDGRS